MVGNILNWSCSKTLAGSTIYQERVDKTRLLTFGEDEIAVIRMSKDDNKGFQINHYHHVLT